MIHILLGLLPMASIRPIAKDLAVGIAVFTTHIEGHDVVQVEAMRVFSHTTALSAAWVPLPYPHAPLLQGIASNAGISNHHGLDAPSVLHLDPGLQCL